METINCISLAYRKPIIDKGYDLLNLIEFYPEVPVYIKIPVKNIVAPIHISFSYFNSEK
jgi:hypothetical protein